MSFIIIGSGGAGISAVEAIREYDRESEIIMISKEDVQIGRASCRERV